VAHANAVLTPAGRLRLARCVVEQRWPLRQAADRFGVSHSTAGKWAARYRRHGRAGLVDRSSRPSRCPHQLTTRTERRIVGCRSDGSPRWRAGRSSGECSPTGVLSTSRWSTAGARRISRRIRSIRPVPRTTSRPSSRRCRRHRERAAVRARCRCHARPRHAPSVARRGLAARGTSALPLPSSTIHRGMLIELLAPVSRP